MGDMADYYSDWDAYDDQEPKMVTLDVHNVKAETDKAWLMVLGEDMEWWLPKSMCTYNPKLKVVDVPDWLYDKKEKGE